MTEPVSIATIDQRRARRILECVEIMQRGCSNAGAASIGRLRDLHPLDCEECAAGFVEAVRRACEWDGQD